MNIIGSPFNKSRLINHNYENQKLYELAGKNKIGLMFLENLSNIDKIGELKSSLISERKSHNELRITAQRIGEILGKLECTYAIVKSNYPFPAVPNDVDVLIFDNKGFQEIVRKVEQEGFFILDEAPFESWIRDHSRNQSKDISDKTPFDIDLYKEMGASQIIYMNKNKLKNHITNSIINNTDVKVLTTPAELALNIFHSIFPERIYTLLLHYYILYAVKSMNESEKLEFIKICKEQKIEYGINTALNITKDIQEFCFHESAKEIENLIKNLGGETDYIINHVPYHYSSKVIVKSFWSRKFDSTFIKCAIRQIISFLNPNYAKYVIEQYNWRKNRDTY